MAPDSAATGNVLLSY